MKTILMVQDKLETKKIPRSTRKVDEIAWHIQIKHFPNAFILFMFFSEYDYEFDSIDQVSDYDNSGSDNDSNVDLYSIVSIPKPKLEPFYKNNSDPDLRSLISNNLSLKSKNGEGEHCDTAAAHVSFKSTTPLNKKQLKKNRSSSLTNAYNTAARKSSEPNVVGNLSTTEKKVKFIYMHLLYHFIRISSIQLNPNSETSSFFLIENSTLRSIVEANCKNDKSNFFIDFQSDIKSLLELILKFDLTDTTLELVVIGTDQSFNSFLKFYAQFFNNNKVLNVFYIPFECTSPLAKLIAKFSPVFCNYFTDHFWTSLSNCDLADNSFQIISRISKYLELGRHQNKKLTFQIGELTIDCAGEDVKSMPFISEVKIELCIGEESTKSVPRIDRKSSLTNSNSLPQFFNTLANFQNSIYFSKSHLTCLLAFNSRVSTNSNTLFINAANPSIDSISYMSSLEVPKTDFHLELDYWRIERIRMHSMIQANENYTSDEYSTITKDQKSEAVNSSKNKIKKRSLSGNFQYIIIYRHPKNQLAKTNKNFDKFFQKELKNFQSTINCARGIGTNLAVQKSVEGKFLSIDYGLKEKKQKSKSLKLFLNILI